MRYTISFISSHMEAILRIALAVNINLPDALICGPFVYGECNNPKQQQYDGAIGLFRP